MPRRRRGQAGRPRTRKRKRAEVEAEEEDLFFSFWLWPTLALAFYVQKFGAREQNSYMPCLVARNLHRTNSHRRSFYGNGQKTSVSWGLSDIAGMAGLCAPSISIFSSLQTIPNGFFEFYE
jgi:hypothetical protein